MSYRTYVNDVQIFGNNVIYPKWIDFIKNNGIEVSEEGSYEGHITDFMDAQVIVEDIVNDLVCERQKRIDAGLCKTQIYNAEEAYKDYLASKDDNVRFGLLGLQKEFLQNAYFYIPYSFYTACSDDIEPATAPIAGRLDAYVLKPGKRIYVRAG